MERGAVLMIFSMVRLFGTQGSASTAHPLPCNPPFTPSTPSSWPNERTFPQAPFIARGWKYCKHTTHTQLYKKVGTNSMACHLYAKCHMLHLHETEQKKRLFYNV